MQHQIVSRDEWLATRKAHFRNQKALTRMRDLITAEPRDHGRVRRHDEDGAAGQQTTCSAGASA